MSTSLSEFSRWAHDAARSADECYTIWLICESARYLDHAFRVKVDRCAPFRPTPLEYYKELFLNPGLVPSFSEEDTETVARMIPHMEKFPHHLPGHHEFRPFRDVGALRFCTALVELELYVTEISDISVLRCLPALRSLGLHSGELTDLSPLADCTGLRTLSLQLIGPTYPSFAPPLHWCDASPLAALQNLETLVFYPNAAVLTGMCFPKLTIATLGCGSTVQRDCAFLPDMPALRQLNLNGVESLNGISRFPELRSLNISGPLRDWGDIAALPKLKCLEVGTLCGWPRNVAPLTAMPDLLWVRFTGEIPRNYWPLTGAPRLCELDAPNCKSIELDVQAINAALTPWDTVFATIPPRELPPLRLLAMDPRNYPRLPETPHQDCVDSPVLFLRELCWMHRKASNAVNTLIGDKDASSGFRAPASYITQRCLSITLYMIESAQRLPEVLDALRQAMARSPHDWHFSFGIHLRVPRHKWGPERQRWWDKLRSYDVDDDDPDRIKRWRMQQQHIIDSKFRVRSAEEDGETPDPEDLRPPDEIRPEPYRRPVVNISGDSSKKDADFTLKPFDEQEQNDDSDEEGGTSVDTDDDPPDWFCEDPDGHPLADSYRFYGLLTFDTFYIQSNLVGTAESLLGKKVEFQ